MFFLILSYVYKNQSEVANELNIHLWYSQLYLCVSYDQENYSNNNNNRQTEKESSQ